MRPEKSHAYYEVFFPEIKTKDDYREVKQGVFENIPKSKERSISLMGRQVKEFLKNDRELAKDFRSHIACGCEKYQAAFRRTRTDARRKTVEREVLKGNMKRTPFWRRYKTNVEN